MRRIIVFIAVDTYKNSFVLASSFEYALSVGKYHRTEAAVVKSLAAFLCGSKPLYKISQFVPFRCIKAYTKCRITLRFVGLRAPFGTVVNARDTRHTENHGVNQRKMSRILYYRSDS